MYELWKYAKIYEADPIVQNMLVIKPAFSGQILMQSDIYFPWATHNTLPPTPSITELPIAINPIIYSPSLFDVAK